MCLVPRYPDITVAIAGAENEVLDWSPQYRIPAMYLFVVWPPPTLQSKHVGFWPPRLLSVQTHTQTQTAAAQTLELQSNMIQHPWLNASFSKNSSCPLALAPSLCLLINSEHLLIVSQSEEQILSGRAAFLCLDVKLDLVFFFSF